MAYFDIRNVYWINEPRHHEITNEEVRIRTEAATDLWQNTYYDFQHDNAPMLVQSIPEPFFSFSVRVAFDSNALFDQAGIVVYQDSANWAKASIEHRDGNAAWLGSVVTNHGYSDWASADIGSEVRHMWYRLSRRGADYRIENSVDGLTYSQMRIFHLHEGDGVLQLGVYACSPSQASFTAVFSCFSMQECLWNEHVQVARGTEDANDHGEK